jgi:hypothetical protein
MRRRDPLFYLTCIRGPEKLGHLGCHYFRIPLIGSRHKNTPGQFLLCFPHNMAVRRVDKKEATLRTELDQHILLVFHEFFIGGLIAGIHCIAPIVYEDSIDFTFLCLVHVSLLDY